MKEISVIIPNFNGKKYLKACLDSLLDQDYPSFEIILVDNGSSDGSVMWTKENYPQVRLIELKENTGFCGGVNAGIYASQAEYVLLLNNDTIVLPGFVRALAETIKSSSRIFSCQAKMLQIQDSSKIDDAGNYYCALGWAFADGKGKPEKHYGRKKEIFASCAGAAIYRKKVLEEIGSFDEEHFAYLEDVDISYRAKLYGYKNIFCPDAKVLHVGSGTSGSRYNLFKIRYSSRNNIYMIYKNMPFWQILWNLPLLIVGFAVKTVFFASKGFGGEYIKGMWNGIRISLKNKEKKVKNVPGMQRRCIKIQLELYKNIGKRLYSGNK
ncbi:MAG: glycosyltransferase family 2 protein [Blautia sp.]